MEPANLAYGPQARQIEQITNFSEDISELRLQVGGRALSVQTDALTKNCRALLARARALICTPEGPGNAPCCGLDCKSLADVFSFVGKKRCATIE